MTKGENKMPTSLNDLYERFVGGVSRLSYLDKAYGGAGTLRYGDSFRFIGENGERNVDYWEYDSTKDELYVELN